MQKKDSEIFEKLSALVDGENHDVDIGEVEQLLDEASSDDRCMRAWQTYHLTRDVLQKDYHSALPADFCASISARLDEEETYVQATDRGDSATGVISDRSGNNNRSTNRSTKVVAFERSQAELPANTAGLARSNRRWKSVAALGMAASVALAAVAGLQLLNSQSGANSSDGPQIARLEPGSSTVQTLTLTEGVVPAVLTVGGTQWRGVSQEGHTRKVEQQLNSYLTNHLEDAAMGKVKGMISHTRVVGYDSNELKTESF